MNCKIRLGFSPVFIAHSLLFAGMRISVSFPSPQMVTGQKSAKQDVPPSNVSRLVCIVCVFHVHNNYIVHVYVYCMGL